MDQSWCPLVTPGCCALQALTKTCRVGCGAPARAGSPPNTRCCRALPDNDGEAAKGKQSGRTIEIQRLIGRSLRAACDMEALGERQVIVDCDVLQADGGTRTASICGGFIALHDALERVVQRGGIAKNPLHSFCSAISVGIVNGEPVLDLPYVEDSVAEVDMNVVMLRPVGGGDASFVEVQGTAEGMTFSRSQLDALLGLAEGGLATIGDAQTALVADAPTPRAAQR